MSKTYWKRWLKTAGIRALKSAAQAAVTSIGISAVMSEVNWATVVSASTTAGILSLLTSLSDLSEPNDTNDVQ